MIKRQNTIFRKTAILLLCTIFSISLSAQDWELVSTPPFFKHHSNGFGFEGKAYVFEGVYESNEVSNEVWEYNPATDEWVRLADFPGARRGIAIGDDWEGKYYYGFGSGPIGGLSDLWVFDPVDTSFTRLPFCPCQGRSHPALVAHNDKVYMGAGSGANSDLNDWWEYDMITQEWSQKPNIPGSRRHHTFQFAMDDYIYVGGGHVSSWHRYDPATEEWLIIDGFPQGRVAGTQFSYKGKGYVLGGDNTFHQNVPNNESFLRYDPLTGNWEELPSLPNGSRWAPSSFIIEDDLYFFGGLSESMPSDATLWKFDLSSLDNPVSTNNLAEDLEGRISVYPNPFQNKLNFESKLQTNDLYKVRVMDVQGRTVFTVDGFNLKNELDLTSIPKGFYFLEISNDSYFRVIKITKGY